MSGVQTLVMKSHQEVSIVDVKNSLMRDLRGVEGLTAMPEESPEGVSVANGVIERSVLEMQSTTRAIAYAERIHETTLEPDSAMLTLAVELSGQVVGRFHRSVSDRETAYDRRKQKGYRKALAPFGELVMFMLVEKRPRTRERAGTMWTSCRVLWTDLTKS